jgi:8-oxo-dGTP pyrophosphatase MutT (NUDIX family)/phosphohistidine phosphatase SixA
VSKKIRAAGGVLWRPAGAGHEVCVVHRPRYDDWSLPKGKLHRGERPLAAAVREVREETGVRPQPLLRLPRVAYDLPDGVPKVVDFWLMRAQDGPPAAADADEVDTVAWLPLPEAAARMSYPDDRRLLEHVAGLPPVTAVLPLVRHAHAGKRDAFAGDDSARPLDHRGRTEAGELGELLPVFAPRRLVSATPLRCRQTLQPLAERLDLPVLADPAFDEPVPGEDLDERAAAAAVRLIEVLDGEQAVVCSQGKVMPPMLAQLLGEDDPKPYRTPKGGGWMLSFSGKDLLAASRL